jgi:hypothetical protein
VSLKNPAFAKLGVKPAVSRYTTYDAAGNTGFQLKVADVGIKSETESPIGAGHPTV